MSNPNNFVDSNDRYSICSSMSIGFASPPRVIFALKSPSIDSRFIAPITFPPTTITRKSLPYESIINSCSIILKSALNCSTMSIN